MIRVTSYARAKSLKRKKRRIPESPQGGRHDADPYGLESGSLNVLKLIQKGESPDDMIQGGQRVMAAGIELSEYIMPGVGGRALSRENALETAKV